MFYYMYDILEDLQISNIKFYDFKPVFLHVMYNNKSFLSHYSK
jgi:hypothetical protein